MAHSTTQRPEVYSLGCPGFGAPLLTRASAQLRRDARDCLYHLFGSLNDKYNLSAKTGSANKDVKPLNHFKLLTSGALWIESYLKANCRKVIDFLMAIESKLE